MKWSLRRVRQLVRAERVVNDVAEHQLCGTHGEDVAAELSSHNLHGAVSAGKGMRQFSVNDLEPASLDHTREEASEQNASRVHHIDDRSKGDPEKLELSIGLDRSRAFAGHLSEELTAELCGSDPAKSCQEWSSANLSLEASRCPAVAATTHRVHEGVTELSRIAIAPRHHRATHN